MAFALSKSVQASVKSDRDRIHKIKGVVGSGISHSDVTGIGIGYNVIVYLEKKDDAVICQLPSEINGIPVVYEVTGKVRKTPCTIVNNQCVCTGFTGAFQGRYRPIQPGAGIINPVELPNYCSVGTLGTIATLNSNGSSVILSNNHVMAYDFPGKRIGKAGDIIIQPGTLDSGNSINDRVATLGGWVTIKDPLSGDNTVDCAYAIINSDININLTSLCNYIIGSSISPIGNMPIKKAGRTTGCTSGTITALDVTTNVDYSDTSTPAIARFTRQIKTSNNFNQAGDSGSVVVNANTNEAVGLLFAGDSNGSAILNAMYQVEAALKITLGMSCSFSYSQV